MAKSITEMAVEITTAQASHTSMSADEAEQFLRKTFQVLKELKGTEEGESSAQTPGQVQRETPAIEPQKSIQRNKVICLECGKEFKVLTNRHLQEHGLDAKEYRKKYGFSTRQPLAAKTLSEKRRKVATDLGLGQKLQEGRKAKAKKQVPAKKTRKSKAKEQ